MTAEHPLLEQYRLATALPAAYLLPSFVSEQEELYILRRIEELGGVEVAAVEGERNEKVTYRDKGTAAGWRTVKGRRSFYLGGQVVKNKLVPAPMPDFMERSFPHLLQRTAEQTGAFEEAKGKKPNHVLVNEYLPGQGISPHEDGPSYFPTVATLSLGSHTILDLYSYVDEDEQGARAVKSEPDCSILLPPRSLFLLTGELYERKLHGIAEREVDSLEQLKACINFSEARKQGGGQNAGKRDRRVSLCVRSAKHC